MWLDNDAQYCGSLIPEEQFHVLEGTTPYLEYN